MYFSPEKFSLASNCLIFESIGSGNNSSAPTPLAGVVGHVTVVNGPAAPQLMPRPNKRAPSFFSLLKLASNWREGVSHFSAPTVTLLRFVCRSTSVLEAEPLTVRLVDPMPCTPVLTVRG